jgi:polyvinyl alcohol dehydrogenase (cytochrome)
MRSLIPRPGRWRWARLGAALAVAALVLSTGTAAAYRPDPGAATTGRADWASWQHDLLGSRHNPLERKINPATVGRLELKWAHVFENYTGTVSSQPAVVGDTAYVGGPDARFYALDATTGATRWVFDLRPYAGPVGPPESTDDAQKNPVRDGAVVAGNTVYFGDYRGNIFALDRFTGRLRWTAKADSHPAAIVTSSPVYYKGRLYVGVSSREWQLTSDDTYPCCTFGGKVVSLDARTGRVLWSYRTVPPAQRVGTWPNGTPKFEPSGGGVWATPAIDPVTHTLYAGTGQNYSGSAGHTDSMLALDAYTGRLKWAVQLTHPDTWNVRCFFGPGGACPSIDASTLDYDVSASPNLIRQPDRTLVGFGQKSGVYHALDAATGRIVWQTELSVPAPNQPWRGIEWGSSYDGHRIYVATWRASPGTLYALAPATGEVLWSAALPDDACTTGGAAAPIPLGPPAPAPQCIPGMNTAATSTPGLVYEGGDDGKIRIYAAGTGQLLWQYDTVRMYDGVNGLSGPGGSIAGNGGAVVANGMLYVKAGYHVGLGIPGQVMLAFGLPGGH